MAFPKPGLLLPSRSSWRLRLIWQPRPFWLLTLLLAILCVWQGMQIHEKHVLLTELASEEGVPDLEHLVQERRLALASRHTQIQQQERWVLSLDAMTFLSWITSQAEKLSAEVIGTEAYPARKVHPLPKKRVRTHLARTYLRHPYQVEVRGEYHQLGRLLHQVEQSFPQLAITGVHLSARKDPSRPQLRLNFETFTDAVGQHTDATGHTSREHAQILTEEAVPAEGTVPRQVVLSNYPDHTGRDTPFSRGRRAEPVLTPMTPSLVWPSLTAIVWDDINPKALLQFGRDARVVQVGEQVGDVNIVSIEPNRVCLLQRGEQQTLALWQSAPSTFSFGNR